MAKDRGWFGGSGSPPEVRLAAALAGASKPLAFLESLAEAKANKLADDGGWADRALRAQAELEAFLEEGLDVLADLKENGLLENLPLDLFKPFDGMKAAGVAQVAGETCQKLEQAVPGLDTSLLRVAGKWFIRQVALF